MQRGVVSGTMRPGMQTMTLAEIYHDIRGCTIHGDSGAEITGVAYDSRHVKPGDLFFCISGLQQDGNRYAKDAVDRGAVAVASTQFNPNLPVPQVVVPHDRSAMAEASAAYCGHPARSMRIVGVTGTNGKTTTTYMLKRIAEQGGHKVGLIGTIRNLIGSEELPTERTTPESPDLQSLLAHMRDSGCDMVVMEVSSHSLALDRTFGIQFDAGVFSNLTQDHLDFHGSFEAYAEAKARLFAQSRVSIINADDPHAQQMANAAGGRLVTYGEKPGADYTASDVGLTPVKTTYTLDAPDGSAGTITVPIPGNFSVYNSMAAAVTATELGFPAKLVREALAAMPSVDGRFEPLDTRGQNFTLILDYAHTPDSLENTLATVRQFARGRVVTVFGCGGNRDSAKRPLMGEIAARLSDRLIVTSDNPRFEDPIAIIEDIEAGIPQNVTYECVPDRRQAIYEAIAHYEPEDVIVLAGKGHETYQEICGVKHDFDEKVVVQEIYGELGW